MRQTLSMILSEREMQIVKLLAEGMSNKDIGVTLHLSEHTIKNYIFNIFEKVECDNRVVVAVRYVKEQYEQDQRDLMQA
jgi:DNA-binding NarL/FixJ family response regulator